MGKVTGNRFRYTRGNQKNVKINRTAMGAGLPDNSGGTVSSLCCNWKTTWCCPKPAPDPAGPPPKFRRGGKLYHSGGNVRPHRHPHSPGNAIERPGPGMPPPSVPGIQSNANNWTYNIPFRGTSPAMNYQTIIQNMLSGASRFGLDRSLMEELRQDLNYVIPSYLQWVGEYVRNYNRFKTGDGTKVSATMEEMISQHGGIRSCSGCSGTFGSCFGTCMSGSADFNWGSGGSFGEGGDWWKIHSVKSVSIQFHWNF